ncbi:hypothetical protein [Actinoplanes sp. NPDC049599]|uniref:hypothetical protein n=1 Tax=Actinoplanes sp. NPDC049599 TaxID=3363903 RepID=UPI0037AD630F
MGVLRSLIPPRLADDLPPKLNEIERLALQWFENYLLINRFCFDAQGNVIADPREPRGPLIGSPARTPEEAAQDMQQQWRIFRDDLTMLRQKFEAFYGLDPLDFTILVGKLGGTDSRVAPDGGAPTSVHDRIGYAYDEWIMPVDGLIGEKQWTGEAAVPFQERFLKPSHVASQQQQAYAQVLAVIAQTYHEAVTTAHRYLLTTADTCIARLNGESGAPGQAADVEALSWVSMISGALSLFPPLSAIAGTISFTTSVAGYARGKQDEPPAEAPIEGTAGPQVIQGAHQVLVSIETGLSDLDAELAKSLSQDLDSTTGFASPHLRLERPLLADGPQTMGTLTIDNNTPMNTNVVVSVVDLYRAGHVNLPGAAGQYAAAVDKLATCLAPGASSTYFPRSVPRFDTARDLLHGILQGTADSLAACGDALVACAKDYRLTDDERAAFLQRIGSLLQPAADPDPTPRRGPI